MEKLNLPDCTLKIKNEEGNEFVFDIVRKKYVTLTPEEWVRQHFIHLMINHLHYPRALISLEFPLTYFKSGKRSDILLTDRKGKPYLLVECKSAKVKLGPETIHQISTYNKVIQAPFIAMTNGLKHFIWEFSGSDYHPLKEFPKLA